MSDTETILAFAGIMLVFALAAIGLDWFGKPVKGRRFVAKMYRYPHERRLRGTTTPWRDEDEPVSEHRASAVNTAMSGARSAGGRLGRTVSGSVERTVRSASERASVDVLADEAAGDEFHAGAPPKSHRDFIAARSLAQKHARATAEHRVIRLDDELPRERGRGWSAGDDVFNLLDDGDEPDSEEVARRYWVNVSAADTARMFGEGNHRRMSEGKAPKRRNRRTGRVESMVLDVPDFEATGGSTPVPLWPTGDVDPFDA
ncbi:MAG: hypothetical protein KDB21_05480 [Acidimicrobiales bacterium]|nr:hypothetical protein [Acidimicrobiales bacterium]